ncbi:hypothetical protein [Nocardia carnea]|uniref:hypothetical protein n=1 Tax=Nocardia carnea TaxID=37328 RepID=UPI0024580012|nr:hypothetical protein [Nocardia carnea]
MTTTHSVSSSRISHRTGWSAAAVTGLGAVATALALASPGAGAVPQNVGADPGRSMGISTPFGTTCTYQVRAAVDNTTQPVTFRDNNVMVGFNPPVVTPNGIVATTTWTPPNPGTHFISAEQGGAVVVSAPIEVRTGINAGTGCAVP